MTAGAGNSGPPLPDSGGSANAALAATIARAALVLRSNDVTPTLIGCAKRLGEAAETRHGSLAAATGVFTGRSPNDKFIVDDETTAETVWWGNTRRMARADFDRLMEDMLGHVKGRTIYHQQLFAGADPQYRYDIELFSESAWHALFIRNLLIRPVADGLKLFAANVSVIHLPSFEADPERHNTRTPTVIALDFTRNIVLICGTAYAGEIKKAVFSLFNFHAPERDVFPMHCSANVGLSGDAALFFGLSGTGKTTLSTEPNRALIGDDEHGWSPDGIFNLEGGCYAKAANLSRDGEPEIYAAAHQPGSVLENVTIDPESGDPDFADLSVTENTRIAYPLTAIPNRIDAGTGSHPRNVVLLTADAFGVLPPIARLSSDQAIYYFLSGYTAKVAGTERGVTEPQATFSACFGAPFMARHPVVYGRLFAERLQQTGADCWLINTGWTGGPYGIGSRMPLRVTRRLLDAALSGELATGTFRTELVFGLEIPVAVDGIDAKLLDPRQTWSDHENFTKQAEKLIGLFESNFEKLGPEAAGLTKTRAAKNRAA